MINKKPKAALLGVMLLTLLTANTTFAKHYTLGVIEFWMPYGIAYVAAEKGFWKDEGIDIDVKMYKGDDAILAFNHGKLDFNNIITSEAIEFIQHHPSNLFIYEYDWSNGGDKLLLAKQIKNLNALQGKTIGVYANTAGVRFFLHTILSHQSSITLADVHLRVVKDTPSLNKAFKRGRFAAVVQFGPEAEKLAHDGIGTVIASSADYPGVIGDGIITRKKLVNKHPELIRKLLRGWMRAAAWSCNPKHQDAYFDILNRTIFKSNPQTPQALRKMQAGIIVHYTKRGILRANGARLTTFTTQVLRYLQPLASPQLLAKPEAFVDTSLALQVANELLP